MARKEYIAELRTRERQIAAELEAIRKILSLEEGEDVDSDTRSNNSNGTHRGTTTTITAKKELPKAEGLSKGTLSWEAYWILVLKELGGRGKATQAAEYAIKANPKIPKEIIQTSAKNKFSALYREKRIGAVKGKIKSQGYEFFIKPEKQENLNEMNDSQVLVPGNH